MPWPKGKKRKHVLWTCPECKKRVSIYGKGGHRAGHKKEAKKVRAKTVRSKQKVSESTGIMFRLLVRQRQLRKALRNTDALVAKLRRLRRHLVPVLMSARQELGDA